jgi:hypothetical protein
VRRGGASRGGGGSARALAAAAEIKVRVQRGLVLLLVGRRRYLGVRARRREGRRGSRGRCALGKKEGRGRTGELTGGDSQSAGEKEGRRARAGAGLAAGPSRPTRERRGGESWAAWRREGRGLGWERFFFGLPFLFSLLPFFSFSTLKPFKQFYLISKEFEFKPYILNTNKTMLQHECTNMLIL